MERLTKQITTHRQQDRVGPGAEPGELDRYRDLFRSAPTAYVETEASGVIREANRAAAALLGVSPEKLAGRSLESLVTKNGRRAFRIQLALLQDGQELRRQELRFSPPDRSPFIAVVDVSPARDDHGQLTALRWILGDVTERRRAEDELRDRETRLRFLIDRMPAILWTTDAELRFTSGDGAGLAALGLGRDLVGMSLHDSFATDDPDSPPIAAHRRALGGESVTYEMQWRGRRYDMRIEPLRAPDSSIAGCLGIAIDMTARADAAIAVLEALEREREASTRLEALSLTKDTMLSAVSHDLRSPLAVVLGCALTLERLGNLDGDDGRDILARLISSALKLDRLLCDLLDLDRLRRGIVEPQRTPTELTALARRIVEEIDVGDHPVSVSEVPVVGDVDPARVERIVENLVGDAVKHTPPETPIWVRAEQTPEGALIVVEDAGPGIPEDLKDVLFDAFARGPSASGTPGAGVGLTLVRRFAELHGGRAWVEDRPGGGASFRVLLPGSAGS